MPPLRPPRAFVVTTGFVFLAVSVVVAGGGYDAGPLIAGVVFLGIGIALPEAYLVASDPSMPRPEAVERVVLVVLAGCGYVAGLAMTGHPPLVGAASMAGALVAESYATARRDARTDARHVS